MGKQRQHRRRHERVRDAVGLERSERSLEFQARHADDRPAACQRVVEHADEPHAVEEGRQPEHRLSLADRVRAGHLAEVGHERAVGELHDLGQPRGAARGQHERDIVGVELDLRGRVFRGQQLGEGCQPGRLAEHEEIFDAGLRSRLGAHGGKRAGGDQHPRPRVAQLARQLAHRVERARGRDHATGAQPGVESEGELGQVGQMQRQHVAAFEAAACESARRARHPGGKLAVPERPSARGVDQRRAAGQPRRVPQGERGQVDIRHRRRRPRAVEHAVGDGLELCGTGDMTFS